MKSSRISVIVALVVILFFPAVFYLFLTSGTHNLMHLPYFGHKELNENGDTIYHVIPDFEFTNQYGEKVKRSDYENKIFVTDFFFTTCQSICPVMSNQLSRVQEKTKEMDDVLILSHTVNPENDSVPVLLDYAQKMNAQKSKWNFVTGDKKSLYDIARNGYFVTALDGDGGPDDFIHSEKFILVDKQGHIRGYYDGTDTKDVDRLIDEIKVLKAIELRPKKAKKQ
jgi:protein SCO1